MRNNNILILYVLGLAFVTYLIFKERKEHAQENFLNVGPQSPINDLNKPSCNIGDGGSCFRNDNNTTVVASKNCSSCSNEKLLPILEPLHNMREISKQIILLEDHLFQKSKRCEDCICKHFLTIEALSEEAITLDKEKQHRDYLETLPDRIRTIQKMYLSKKKDTCDVAQELRNIRKEMMVKSFKFF